MSSSSLENAIADMRRQLRSESKSELIRTWLALYAQKVLLEIENDKLKSSIKQMTEAGASAETGSGDQRES